MILVLIFKTVQPNLFTCFFLRFGVLASMLYSLEDVEELLEEESDSVTRFVCSFLFFLFTFLVFTAFTCTVSVMVAIEYGLTAASSGDGTKLSGLAVSTRGPSSSSLEEEEELVVLELEVVKRSVWICLFFRRFGFVFGAV